MQTALIYRYYILLSYILLVMGIIHCMMVLVLYDELSLTAIFSLGTGLAVSFLGMLNLAAAKIQTPLLFALALIANIMQSIYSGLSLIVMKDDPKAYIGFCIFLIALIISWIAKRKATLPYGRISRLEESDSA